MSSDWRKSSHSGGQSVSCVEVRTADAVLVRDTTDRDGAALSLPPTAWRAFIMSINRAG